MKKILFVMNTMGRAGAEKALLELFKHIDRTEYEISLFVLTGQGELISEVPEYVKILNKNPIPVSVHSEEGRRKLIKSSLKALFTRFNFIRLIPYFVKNLKALKNNGVYQPEKLLWRVYADGTPVFDTKYDIAVSFIEGGAAYYVADHVNAEKKAAFIHVDYSYAGYTRKLDKECYLKFDRIFAVSGEVAGVFNKAYPELSSKTEIFPNMIDREEIKRRANEGTGFTDGFSGVRILTIGRLSAQKSLETSIETCHLLKKHGENIRWYVLGEGHRRRRLEEYIKKLGLEESFLLLGSKENPYAFIKEADIFVHCTRFEGKSLAVQEAQVLGKPIIVSNCSGNRELIINGEDGAVCDFDPKSMAKSIYGLIHDENTRRKYSENAAKKEYGERASIERLLDL